MRPVLTRGGNRKLGKTVATLSRTVGPTCPPSCPFLKGEYPSGDPLPKDVRCYAGSMQAFRKSVAQNWADRTEQTREPDFYSRLADALKKQTLVRLHVGGDFWDQERGQLDRTWILNLLQAVKGARSDGWTGRIWLYTHCWRELPAPWLRVMQRAGIVVYASVHTVDECEQALAKGFLLAFDARDSAKHSGRVTIAEGITALACPEQIKGHEKVTCDKCQYCPKGLGNVAFFWH